MIQKSIEVPRQSTELDNVIAEIEANLKQQKRWVKPLVNEVKKHLGSVVYYLHNLTRCCLTVVILQSKRYALRSRLFLGV